MIDCLLGVPGASPSFASGFFSGDFSAIFGGDGFSSSLAEGGGSEGLPSWIGCSFGFLLFLRGGLAGGLSSAEKGASNDTDFSVSFSFRIATVRGGLCSGAGCFSSSLGVGSVPIFRAGAETWCRIGGLGLAGMLLVESAALGGGGLEGTFASEGGLEISGSLGGLSALIITFFPLVNQLMVDLGRSGGTSAADFKGGFVSF